MGQIAIIGTAGRKDDADKLYPELYPAMIEKAWQTAQAIGAKNPALVSNGYHLVSGGAAWADHVAVRLFLEGKANQLTLHLPAPFDTGTNRFFDKGTVDPIGNPGGTLNYYHRIFSKRIDRNTLAEIGEAIRHGAQVTVSQSEGRDGPLEARNTKVAGADALVAMTFGAGAVPKPGGTSRTVQKYLARIEGLGLPNQGTHVDLSTMYAHSPIAIKVQDLAPKFRASMYFSYSTMARPEIKAKTTFEAILNHERTSTTRYPEDPGYERWANLKPGDLVEVFETKTFTGRSALLRITATPQPIDFKTASPERLEEWSKREGWSTNYCKAKVAKGDHTKGIQIGYELVRVKEAAPIQQKPQGELPFLTR